MKTLLKQAERNWEAIAHNLLLNYPDLPNPVRQIAQRIILVTFCLAICEERKVVTPGQLQQISNQTNLYLRLTDYWCGVGLSHASNFSIDPQQLNPTIADDLLRDLLSGLAQSVSQGEVIPIAALGQLHEMFLAKDNPRAKGPNVSRRKAAGAYYTPGAIAHYMIQTTVGPLLKSCPKSHPTPLRILDPTCGGGIFLLTAYQFLLDHKKPLTQTECSQILLNHLYGVDLDPQAVEVTRLSLLLKLLESLPQADLSQLPNLSHNIQVGNAIVGQGAPPSHEALQHEALHPLDWQSAFPKAMQTGGFEVVIGNPPYIDSETMTRWLPHCRHYCTTHYQAATGNWDIFCVFIERALQLCKPGGLSSLIVPNKLLSADYAAAARSLLYQNQLLSIRDYSRVSVFAVAVYPLVYVVQKKISSPDSTIRYELMQSVEEVAHSHLISQAMDLAQSDSKHFNKGSPWLIAIQPQQADLIVRMRQFPKLGAIAQVTGAATVAEAYAIQPLIQDSQTPTVADLQLVNSGTLDRYRFLWGKKRLRYLGASYLHPVIPAHLRQYLPRKREQQAIAPKILIAGMTRKLECALDSTGQILAAKSTSVIQSKIDLRYLLGILNSKLIHFYFTSSFASNSLSGGYLRVGPPQLKQIPICWEDEGKGKDRGDRHNHLIHWVEQMLLLVSAQQKLAEPAELQEFHNQINAVNQQIDQLVCGLYGLTEAEIAMVLAFAPDEKVFAQ
ncbi:MAG: N-6 DNA methylase [Leptolyngbyaceae cyanobacterium RM1_406_9]|nr:N-6 DNA methylase [Leptolyngbyaceae cyanobacterium RM1_406_9]